MPRGKNDKRASTTGVTQRRRAPGLAGGGIPAEKLEAEEGGAVLWKSLPGSCKGGGGGV